MDKIQRNKELIERYPFLMPNDWKEEGLEEYDYSYTELDGLPTGWRIAFGEELCEEILQELVATNTLETYEVSQIKEKFGELRWYDEGGSPRIWHEILPKYEQLAARTCVCCGKPATKRSRNWVSPWCDACAETTTRERFVDLKGE